MTDQNTPPQGGSVETEVQKAERELAQAREAVKQAQTQASATHTEYEAKAREAADAAEKVTDLKARIKDAEISAAHLHKQADELERAEMEAKRLADEAVRRRLAAEEKAKLLEEALAAVKTAEQTDAAVKQARAAAQEAVERAQAAEAADRKAKAEAAAKLAAIAPKASPAAPPPPPRVEATPPEPATETPAAPPPTPPAPPETDKGEGAERPKGKPINTFDVVNGKLDDLLTGQKTNRWLLIAGVILILLFLCGSTTLLHGEHMRLPRKMAAAFQDDKGNWFFANVCKDVKATVSESALQNAFNKAACMLSGETAPESAPIRECKRRDYRCYYSDRQPCRDGLDFLDPDTCVKKADRVCEGGFKPADVLTDAFKSEARACPKKKAATKPKPAPKTEKEETKKEDNKESKTATSATSEVPPPPPPPPAPAPIPAPTKAPEPEGKACDRECPPPKVETQSSSSSLGRIALADVKPVKDGQIKLIKRPGPDGCQLALRVAADVGYELYRKGSASPVISGSGVFVQIVDVNHPYLLTLRSSKGYLFRMGEDEAKMDQVVSRGEVISNLYFEVNEKCDGTKPSDF